MIAFIFNAFACSAITANTFPQVGVVKSGRVAILSGRALQSNKRKVHSPRGESKA